MMLLTVEVFALPERLGVEMLLEVKLALLASLRKDGRCLLSHNSEMPSSSM